MEIIKPILMGSVAELIDALPDIKTKFIENGVVAIRGLNASLDDQYEITRKFGDIIDAIPNSDFHINEVYQENHSRNKDLVNLSKDDIAVVWHMEHIEFSGADLVAGGIWRMFKFQTDTANGNTYFVDTSKIYEALSDEEKELIDSCTMSWYNITSEGNTTVTIPAVIRHWLTGKKVLRMGFDAGAPIEIMVGNRPATAVEKSMFLKIRQKFFKYTQSDDKYRQVHQWQEGDIVFVDLAINAHAVAGGFDPNDREFTGMWMYVNPNDRTLDE